MTSRTELNGDINCGLDVICLHHNCNHQVGRVRIGRSSAHLGMISGLPAFSKGKGTVSLLKIDSGPSNDANHEITCKMCDKVFAMKRNDRETCKSTCESELPMSKLWKGVQHN